MSTVKGPAMSLQASGRLGPDLHFRKAKGGAIAATNRTPQQLPTANQIISRALYSHGAALWSSLSTAQQDCFNLADDQPGTNKGFSMYIGSYMRIVASQLLAALRAQFANMTAPEIATWTAAAAQYTQSYQTPFSAGQAFELTAPTDLYTYHGLCAFWPMSEPEGMYILDYSGNGFHALLMPTYPANCPTRVTDPADKSRKVTSFNGSSHYINAGQDAKLQDLKSVVTDAQTTTPATSQQITGREYMPVARGKLIPLTLQIEASKARFMRQHGPLPIYSTGATSLQANTWARLCATWNVVDGRIYYDGVLDGTPVADTTAVNPAAKDREIGRYYTGLYFNGLLKNMRCYNRALALSET
jgi:hypothetical protein